MGLEVLTGGDRPLVDQPEWDRAVAAAGLPISPYVAKAAYVAQVLAQTVEAARLCWEKDLVLAAYTATSSGVDLLGYCLGKSGKDQLPEALRFLETVPCSVPANTPMPVVELIAARRFTTHGAVYSSENIKLSEDRWRRVTEPLDASRAVFWAAGRPDDEERFSAFAAARVTPLSVNGSPEPVFVRDVYNWHTT